MVIGLNDSVYDATASAKKVVSFNTQLQVEKLQGGLGPIN